MSGNAEIIVGVHVEPSLWYLSAIDNAFYNYTVVNRVEPWATASVMEAVGLFLYNRGDFMIELRHIDKEFVIKKQHVRALQDVSLTVQDGDIFGIVGFSGAGKSTLLRMVNALEEPTAGEVLIDGVNINELSHNELRKVRKGIGMIF